MLFQLANDDLLPIRRRQASACRGTDIGAKSRKMCRAESTKARHHSMAHRYHPMEMVSRNDRMARHHGKCAALAADSGIAPLSAHRHDIVT